ncbi:MAG: hypothetical protein AAF467_08855 [Actinomycetota bacterium]
MTTSPTPNTTPGSSRKTVRYLAGAALVSGGLVLGAMFAPVNLAGAQTDTDTSAESTDEAPAEGRRDGGRKGHRGERGDRAERLAEVSGLSVEQITEGFEANMSLAEIATENGVDVDALAADLEASMTDKINEKVAEGRITQEEADEKLAGLADKIDEKLNMTPEERQELRAERRAERQAERDADADADADDADVDEEEVIES